jgi:hypothetical protein
VGTPLRSPAFEIESFSPRNESPRPSRRTLHLPGSARGGRSISCPSSATMCGRRTSVPRNRTVPSSTHPRGARLRCSHHGGCTIYGSRSVRTQVSPRWSARYTSSHHRQSGVREGARFTEAPPLTANNSRDGARTLLGPHPVPTAESVLHLAGRFFPSGIDHGNHPTVANVSSTALQRFTPRVCVAAPEDHARTWTASYSKLAPSLGRFGPRSYFHEADYCPAPGDHTRRSETFPV